VPDRERDAAKYFQNAVGQNKLHADVGEFDRRRIYRDRHWFGVLRFANGVLSVTEVPAACVRS
jgi:hypothetical protein